MYISEGDWVIKGVENEQYPCKPDIFAKTYQEVYTEYSHVNKKIGGGQL